MVVTWFTKISKIKDQNLQCLPTAIKYSLDYLSCPASPCRVRLQFTFPKSPTNTLCNKRCTPAKRDSFHSITCANFMSAIWIFFVLLQYLNTLQLSGLLKSPGSFSPRSLFFLLYSPYHNICYISMCLFSYCLSLHLASCSVRAATMYVLFNVRHSILFN